MEVEEVIESSISLGGMTAETATALLPAFQNAIAANVGVSSEQVQIMKIEASSSSN